MKFLTRFVILLIFSLVGFRQYQHYCEDNSAAFCQFSSPSDYVWYQQHVTPWWNERASPYVEQYIKPCVLKAQNYRDQGMEWIVPKAQQAFYTSKDVFDTKVYPTLYQCYKTSSFKCQLYYNVHVVPRFRHLQNQVAKWIHGHPALHQYLQALQLFSKSVMECTMASWRYLTRTLSELKAFIKSVKFEDITDGDTKDHEIFSEDTNPTIEGETNTPETSDETDTEDYDEDYYEEETIFITSTVLETVTLSDDRFQMTPASASAPEDTQEASLDIPITELVQDEFQAWSNTIESKANKTIEQFDQEIQSFVKAKLEEVHPRMIKTLQDISNSTQEYYQKINLAILDVECTPAVDPTTGEHIYFNRAGTQLREYITRPLMREYFSATRDHLDQRIEHVKNELERIVAEVNSAVEDTRQEHLEVYEEWGDVMVSEWSKRMAYVDVVAAMDDENMDEQQHENWKSFLRLKKQVIHTRDSLMEHPAKLEDLEKFLREIQFTLKALQRESGEYLYILRSKANLAFQAREKLEREREEEERLDRERQKQEKEESERLSVEMLLSSINTKDPQPEELVDDEIPMHTTENTEIQS